ncbi:MAG: HAD family phosphatase [Brooklawnia sp.]|nr:HAD family phosphatase [Brooklawnia sp.]
MNPFDVIATDLDGTFLTDDQQVPQINAHAVRVAARRGIPTIYASGRPVRWFGVLDELVDTHGWAVAANGAVTLDLAAHRVVHARTMSAALIGEVTHEIRRMLPTAGFAVEYLSAWGAEPHFLQRTAVPDLQAPMSELLERGSVVKLLVVDPATPTEDLAEAVHELVDDRFTVTFSHVAQAGMLELSAAGVSKALALAELLDDLGLAASRMIAFGDMPNDLAMLALAGQGFTMSRAHPSVLAAGYRASGDNNDAGVGRTILQLLGEPLHD